MKVSIFSKMVLTRKRAIVNFVQMRMEAIGGAIHASTSLDSVEYVVAMRNLLRNMEMMVDPLNQSAPKVFRIIERALGPSGVKGALRGVELTQEECETLFNAVHALMDLLENFRSRNPKVVDGLRGKLKGLAVACDACPV